MCIGHYVYKGCQIFLGAKYQNEAKIYQLEKISNVHKIYQMTFQTFQMAKKFAYIFFSEALQNFLT
jgi:hypothetical protein